MITVGKTLTICHCMYVNYEYRQYACYMIKLDFRLLPNIVSMETGVWCSHSYYMCVTCTIRNIHVVEAFTNLLSSLNFT